MQLQLLGINHNSASLALRERLAFVPERLSEAYASGMAAGCEELMILSTCNRSEIYAVGVDEAALLTWLAEYQAVDLAELQACSYGREGEAALSHLIQVSAGLDSLVLGEPQIMGQMKSAFNSSGEYQAAGPVLTAAFQHGMSVAKKIRTDTAIGENPVSVAFAAVSLTQHIFADLSRCTVLLIGAGETVELVAKHLHEKGLRKMLVANRTLSRAQDVAAQFGGEAILLGDIPEALRRADIVVASTASQLPILGKGAVESALRQRKHRPYVMVDIAVPRDIEPEVGELADVYLYTVDDLRDIVDENRRARESEVSKADEIIAEGMALWAAQQRELAAVDTVKAYRAQAEAWRDAEIERALRALQRGDDSEAVLRQLGRGLTNKLLHEPSARMRQLSAEGKLEQLAWARDLLGLPAGDDQQDSE